MSHLCGVNTSPQQTMSETKEMRVVRIAKWIAGYERLLSGGTMSRTVHVACTGDSEMPDGTFAGLTVDDVAWMLNRTVDALSEPHRVEYAVLSRDGQVYEVQGKTEARAQHECDLLRAAGEPLARVVERRICEWAETPIAVRLP